MLAQAHIAKAQHCDPVVRYRAAQIQTSIRLEPSRTQDAFHTPRRIAPSVIRFRCVACQRRRAEVAKRSLSVSRQLSRGYPTILKSKCNRDCHKTLNGHGSPSSGHDILPTGGHTSRLDRKASRWGRRTNRPNQPGAGESAQGRAWTRPVHLRDGRSKARPPALERGAHADHRATSPKRGYLLQERSVQPRVDVEQVGPTHEPLHLA